MDLMSLGVLAALIAGVIIGFLLSKVLIKKDGQSHQLGSVRLELQFEQKRGKDYEDRLQKLNKQLEIERASLMKANGEKASLEANYKNLSERFTEQKEEVKQLQDRFSAEFKNLANEIFEEKSKKFTDQNRTSLDELLKPLGQKLTDFEKKVEQTNKDALVRNAALREQITGLKDLNQRMSQEAENLTKALKGDAKMQGNWGEIVLERILEESGLKKDREYFTQTSIATETGRHLRPDVIIKLPDNKNMVIDAKTSLVAYEKYVNAEDEEERDACLKGHLSSVKAHIKGLSQKGYQQVFETGTPDYVLMFVPIEPAFALIMEKGGTLYNEANHQNIFIASPTTLIAILRTVASIWKQEHQNQNALEIARKGGALYDKFAAFVDDLLRVGKSLSGAKNTYDNAMNKLVNGSGNLVRKTEHLRDLGVKASKSIDPKVLIRAGVKEATPTPETKDVEEVPKQKLFGG